MLQAGEGTDTWVTLSKSLPSADLKDLQTLPAHSEQAREWAGSTRGRSHGPACLGGGEAVGAQGSARDPGLSLQPTLWGRALTVSGV